MTPAADEATASETVCPGCGARLPAADWPLPEGLDASRACFERLGELTSWTQSLGDPFFPHQYAVDAYAAQHASDRSPPIGTTFALIGLYLACERGLTGREVQLAHMSLAKRKREWPRFHAPPQAGAITAVDVLAAPDRLAALRGWTAAVWAAWSAEHPRVRALVSETDLPAPRRRR